MGICTMYFGGYYKQVSREPDNVWKVLKQMRNYFSKTRAAKEKLYKRVLGVLIQRHGS